MIPPVDASTLAKNPQFAQLYKHLTHSALNSDGSTKLTSSKQSRRATAEQLKAFQVETARQLLLRSSLAKITSRVDELPDELLGVIEAVAAQLNNTCSTEDREILEDDVEYFMGHLRPIGRPLSDHLSESALQLAYVAHPSQKIGPNTARTLLSSLPQEIVSRREHLFETQDALSAEQQGLVSLACNVLEAHRELLEAIIKILEQTKHGSVSRGFKAHADHLAVVVANMDAKLRVLKHEALVEIYTPSVQSALQNYERHLEDTTTRLRQRRKAAEDEVRKYSSAGDGMSEIVSKYSSLLKETDAVRVDIRRLGGEA